jgi:Na+-transporting methylmalonyl-CoA/oxaloacetate decarboxylase gamma subunit
MGVVFIALAILFYFFAALPRVIEKVSTWKLRKEGKISEKEEVKLDINVEVSTAIAAALFLYFNEQHDLESDVMTIKRISKTYSPWSSKIYNVNLFK